MSDPVVFVVERGMLNTELVLSGEDAMETVMDPRLEEKMACWKKAVDVLRERIGGLLDDEGFSSFARTRYIGLGGMRPVDLVQTDDGMEILIRFIDEAAEAWEPHPISL